MKLLLAAGGTGGHVIPALVVAEEFCRRGGERQALFVGTARGLETRIVPQAGFPLELMESSPLLGQSLAARLKSLFQIPKSILQAQKILQSFRPQVVLGVGGYAGGPIMMAAAWGGIPLAVLEPNAQPGLANRWAGPYVARAFLAFREAESYFPAGAARVFGLPVRAEFFRVKPKCHEAPVTILVFGGSQGARSLNRAMVEALPRLSQSRYDPVVLHQTGQSEYNAVREAYAKFPIRAEVSPFIDKMPEAFSRADLIVCRAGANAVAELAAAGRAAILVPFPAAAHQHQLRNAEVLERKGAARLILDRELNGERLFAAMAELIDDPQKLCDMEAAIRPMARPDAASQIVDELERLGGQPKRRGAA